MAEKTKVREITITDDEGTFNAILKKITGEKGYDFEAIGALRKLLSNQRARLLNVLKKRKPESIYGLAKALGRDFKSVNGDIKLLERFGLVDLISEKKGNRARLRPVLVASTLQITLKL